ncbi:hypothetical protein [Geobacter sulfurreducens]|uniref:hypothetical protein n=1 Tax=Geobacter sulfurreducens TaxID=35554 RepID=UPI0020B8CC89|nr:hypothetical protein [Geobacter sulfurreducens]UTG91754.1 hypothetical protein J8622_12040 [Geobacter sulfurreducens]
MMKLLARTIFVSLALLFASCGDRNHSSEFVVSGHVTELQFNTAPSGAQGNVVAKAAFANVSGAVVEAFLVDDYGNKKEGSLGTAVCDSFGTYRMTLPAETRKAGVLVIGVMLDDPTSAMRAFVTGPIVDIDLVSEYVFRDTIRPGHHLGQVPVSDLVAHTESVRFSIQEISFDQAETLSDALVAIYTLCNPPLLGNSELSVQAVADAIKRYLELRPNSADTVEGIKCWWIDWGMFQGSDVTTQIALELLEQQGVVEQLAIGNRIFWRKKRA